MITRISHKEYIDEKMKEDPVDHDIIEFFYSHQKGTPKEKRTGGEATPSVLNIEIRKGENK